MTVRPTFTSSVTASGTLERRTLNSTVLGLIQLALNFVVTILLVPVLIATWGTGKYGFYLNIFAFLQLLRTLDLGHQAYIGNEFNREYHTDKQRARELLASSIPIAILLGLLEVFIFLGLWWTGKLYEWLGVTQEEASPVLLGIFFMVIMWWLVGSISGILVKVVLSKGVFAHTVIWAILYKLLEVIVLVVAAYSGLDLFYFLTAWAIINLFYFYFVIRWAFVVMKDLELGRQFASWKIGWTTFRKSLIITFTYGFEQSVITGINLLITRYVSILILPVYTTIRTLTNTAIQLSIMVTNPLQPELIRYHSEQSVNKIKSVFKAFWVVNGSIVNVGLLAIMPVIKPIYHIWTKNQLAFDFRLFGLLCLSVSVYNLGRPLVTYLNGINDLRAVTGMSIARFLITLGIIFFFIKAHGLLAVGIGVLVGEIIASLIIPLIRMKQVIKQLGGSLQLLELLFAFLPVIILGLVYTGFIFFNMNALIVTIVGLSGMGTYYILAWNSLEPEVKNRFKSLIARYLKMVKQPKPELPDS